MRVKVLVTGGAGFIGSNIVDRLVAEAYKVKVIYSLTNGSKNLSWQSERVPSNLLKLRKVF